MDARIIMYLLLIILFYQDMKLRAVSWFIFPLLYISAAAFVSVQVIPVMKSLLLILILLSFLQIYILIRHREYRSLLEFIGLGDILLLPFIAMLFPGKGIMMVLVILFMLSLLLHYSFRRFYSDKHKLYVPLAGLMSISSIPLIFYHAECNHILSYLIRVQ